MLNEKTILYPFQDEYGVPRTSSDCINIVCQLGYDYSIASLDQATWPEPEKVKFVSLLDRPSTTWQDILDKLGKEALNIVATAPGAREVATRHRRLRMIFDRTQFTSPVVSAIEVLSAFPGFHISPYAHIMHMTYPHIPIFPTSFIASTLEGLPFKFKNFVQVKDVNKDKISGSFVVQVFYRATGKLFYLGQRGVLSRWNRSNCANCQGRRMAHISIPTVGATLLRMTPRT